jgi:bifunctional non-homologous end joining protein LigD
VPKEGGGTTIYPVIHDVEAIAFYANLGVITFHVPAVKVEDVWRPDWAIWDLDPPPERIDLARAAAHVMREVLDSHGIDTHPMTSGSKGYHLRVRLTPGLDSEEVAGMARGAAAVAAERHPDLLTLAFLKKERGDRVFVDWLRNAPYSTAVAPWSLRPRRGAPVATPLSWDEVDDVDPDGVRIGDAVSRLGSDPWAKLPSHDLADACDRVARSVSDAGIVLEPFDRFRSGR